MRLKINLTIIPFLMMIGLATSSLAAFWLYDTERKNLITMFEREIDLRALSLHKELKINVEALHELAIFFEKSHIPKHDEFRDLAQEVMQHLPSIHTLEWIPRVTSENQTSLLNIIRKSYPDYALTQENEQGMLVPASPEEEYFPVYFVEPSKGNESTLGFDFSSCQNRYNALKAARDSGLPQATGNIEHSQNRLKSKAFLVLMPVYNGASNTIENRQKNLTGFVLGTYKTDDLFKLSEVIGQSSDLHMKLVDKTNQKMEVLAENFSEIEQDGHSHDEQPLHYEKELPPSLGRQWAVTSHPSKQYISNNMSPLPYVVLLFGVAFTVLIASYAGLLIRRNSTVNRMVKEKAKDLMKAQDANKNYQNKMIEMNKMASLGEMSAGIGHELSQPLGTILLKCQMLPKIIDKREYEKSLQMIEDIRLQAIRAKEIMDSLRVISRDAKPEDRTSLDLSEAVRNAEVLIKDDLMMSKVKVQKELTQGVYIYASPVQLGQVITNLMNNARDALEDSDEKVITLRSYIKDDNGILEIEDTGPGIPEDYQSKIFEPFFTSKPVGKGTGLGLSMCYSMIQDNEGDISFKTAPGEGTCFTLSIPLTSRG